MSVQKKTFTSEAGSTVNSLSEAISTDTGTQKKERGSQEEEI